MVSNHSRRVDVYVVSQAVAAWCEFYEVDPGEKELEALAEAATQLYLDGRRSADDLATGLIGTYIGPWSLVINAPKSASVH